MQGPVVLARAPACMAELGVGPRGHPPRYGRRLAPPRIRVVLDTPVAADRWAPPGGPGSAAPDPPDGGGQPAVGRPTHPRRTRKLGLDVSERTVCLLKSPLLVRQLMLRPTMDTLLGDEVGAPVLPSDPANMGAFARFAPTRNPGVIRHQLEVLQRTRPRRLRLAKPDGWLWSLLARIWTGWRTALVIVKPETVIAWHRRGFRLWWVWRSGRRKGRPAVTADVRRLIRTMARANPRWGAPRIHGELLKLGIDVCQATVAKYMRRQRQPPSQNWRTFLRNHIGQVVAADFFVVPTATYRLLFVLVLLAHDRRDAFDTSRSPRIRRPRGRPNSCARRFRGMRRLVT